jgi:ketosteroid isomerase-like protein
MRHAAWRLSSHEPERRPRAGNGTIATVSVTAEQRTRLAYERYSAGDLTGMLELFDPAVEVFVAPPNFESGTYRGHAEYRALVDRWGASWDEMRVEPGKLETAGDWVLACVEYIGLGKGSSVEVTQPSWELSQWPAGLCVRYEVYWDRAEGLAAFAERARG